MSVDDGLVARLERVLKARGWTPYEWSQRAVLSDATVANMIGRRSKGARPDTLTKLAKAAGVSFAWLASGEGEMEPAPAQLPALAPPSYEVERRPAKREQLALARAFKDTGDRVTDEDFYAVQEVLRTGEMFPVESEEELVEGMRAWLYGAAELRRMERPVTYAGIAWALATPRQREADAARSEAVNREGREELEKLGVPRPRVPVQTPARPLPAALAAPVKTPPRGTPAAPKTVKKG